MSLHIQSFFVVLKCQENYPSKCHPISRVSIDGHIAFGLVNCSFIEISIIGRNHVHLTVRLGFVTQYLWLGNFGKCYRGIFVHELFGYVTQSLRLRFPSAH